MCACVCVGLRARLGHTQEANRGKPHQLPFRRPVAVAVARVPDALPRLAEATPMGLPPLHFLRPKGKHEDFKFMKVLPPFAWTSMRRGCVCVLACCGCG